MKLSDAFIAEQEEPLCELKVNFMNIRGEKGENLPVVQNCGILKEYCEFMDIVFRYQAELKSKSTKEEVEGCYDKAIKEAISKGILVDYLTRKGTEVRNMFFGEYDYDLDMKVKAQEAAENKAVEAALLLVHEYKEKPEIAAQKMNAPLELVLEGLKNKPVTQQT